MAKIRKYTKTVSQMGEAVQWELETEPGDKTEIIFDDGTTISVESSITIQSHGSIGKDSIPDSWQMPIKMITDLFGASKHIRRLLDAPKAIECLQVLMGDTVLIRLIEFSVLFNFSMDAETKLIAKGGLTKEGYAFFESQEQES